jgi:hypothetical protein
MSEKGFFAVSVSVLHDIVARGGDASELLAYLVLAKHTKGRGDNPHTVSTAGCKAIYKKTGMSYRRAEGRLEWLSSNGFITPSEEPPREGRPRASAPRWILPDLDPDIIYLSHSLVDGIGAGKENPPLMRIWDDTQTGVCKSFMDAKTDLILVLANCYKEHELMDYGGIDPKLLSRKWIETPAHENLEGFKWRVLEVEPGNAMALTSFQERVLGHLPAEVISARFFNALNNMEELGLVYEVLEVWNGNPLEDERAELYFPLYVRDLHARQTDPYCQKDIHTFIAAYLDGMAVPALFNDSVESGTFRLLATGEAKQYVVGTYRMRFRPHTQDTGKGMAQEEKRAERYRSMLERTQKAEHTHL